MIAESGGGVGLIVVLRDKCLVSFSIILLLYYMYVVGIGNGWCCRS